MSPDTGLACPIIDTTNILIQKLYMKQIETMVHRAMVQEQNVASNCEGSRECVPNS